MVKVLVLVLVRCAYHTGSQYCIIMCIYHSLPLLDYAISGQDPQLLCTSVEPVKADGLKNSYRELLNNLNLEGE